MAPTLFRILLAIVAAIALLRGGRDERTVGLICVVGTFVTEIALSPLHQRFEGVETQALIVDLAVLAGFLAVALQSARFWPLWVAGLQLTTIMGHLVKGIESDLLPRAYGAAMTFWSYPIIVILAVGTWRSHQRRRREQAAGTTSAA
jgi:hypothetical protein